MINAHFPLGKKKAVHSPKTLKLAAYTVQLPPPPASVDWTGKVPSFPMFANDRVGDCTIAAPGHMEQIWTANAGRMFTPTEDQILADYSKITGYNPQDPTTDRGAIELDVLNAWRQNGIAGRKIRAFMACHGLDDIKQSIALLGGVYFGFALPLSVRNKTSWDIDDSNPAYAEAGSWGGHAVNGAAYDQASITVISWGQKLVVSLPFVQRYCDEAYAIVTDDWIEADQKSPSGFNINQLMADLAVL